MRELAFDFLFKGHPTPMLIYEWETLRIVDVNESAVAHYGFSRAEFLGMTLRDIRPPEEIPELQRRLSLAREGTWRDPAPVTHWKKDGTRIQVEVVSFRFRDGNRGLGVLTLNDVTERVATERRLRESERRFRGIFNASVVAMSLNHRDGRILEANDAFLQMTGYTREDVESGKLNYVAMTPPEYFGVVQAAGEEAEAKGYCSPFRQEVIRKDGSRFTAQLAGALLDGLPEQGVTYMIDLTASLRAEEALRATEARFRGAFNAHEVGMAISRRDGTMAEVNDAFLRMTGYSRADFEQGRVNWLEMTPPEYLQLERAAHAEVGEKGHCTPFRKEYVRKDGTRVPVLVGGGMLEGSNDEVIAFALDLSGLQHAEDSLRKMETRFRRMFDSNLIGIVTTDLTGQIHDANDAFLDMLGFNRADLLAGSINWRTITPPEYAEVERHALEELQRTGVARPLTKEYFHKDGTRVPVVVGASFLDPGSREGVAFIIDISRWRQLEHRLVAAESRLEQLLSNLPVVLTSIDRDGNYSHISGSGLAESGFKAEDFLGKTVWELFPEESPFAQSARRALNGEVGQVEIATGEQTYDMFYGPIRGADGRVVGATAIAMKTTETRLAKEAQRESERQFKALVEAAPVIFFRTNERDVFTLVEGQGVARLRKDPRKAIGRTFYERYRNFPHLIALYERARAGETLQFDAELDGEWFDNFIGPMRDEKGRINGVVGISTVITERKRTEEAWHQAEARLRFTLTNAPLALFALDRNGIATLSEGAALKSLGLEPGQLVGRNILDLYANDPVGLSLLRRALAGEEISAENSAGNLWFGLHFRPIRNAAGEPDGVVGVVWDITDRKRAERAWQEAEARLRFTISVAPMTLFTLDRKGDIKLSEGAALESLGAKPGELVGRNIFSMYADSPEVCEDFRRVLEDGVAVVDEREFAGVWFERHLMPIRDQKGRLNGLVGVAWDVSERKRAKLELERLNQELREALRARDEFLSVAAHELRTPLTTLRMQMELVSAYFRDEQGVRPTPEQLRRVAELGEIEFDRLTKLIHNLLDVSRIRSGKLVLQPSRVDLSEVVRLTAERFAAQARASGAPLSVDAREPLQGNWDRYRVEQVLVNLIFNAIKYGGKKPIRVRTLRENGRAVVEVQDQGPGIAEEDQERLFGRFERLDNATAGGMGLGLFISKEIAEAHGGKLTVRSRLGEGAVFRLELPT